MAAGSVKDRRLGDVRQAATVCGKIGSVSHDVFISYSSKDKTVAEQRGIRCWIAPHETPIDDLTNGHTPCGLLLIYAESIPSACLT
jgi:hypothetical protein